MALWDQLRLFCFTKFEFYKSVVFIFLAVFTKNVIRLGQDNCKTQLYVTCIHSLSISAVVSNKLDPCHECFQNSKGYEHITESYGSKNLHRPKVMFVCLFVFVFVFVFFYVQTQGILVYKQRFNHMYVK